MPHHRIPPGQLLCRGPVGDPCQPPPPLIWQHRQIQLVSVQPAQIRQLLQLRLHPTRRRIRRALPQPGQGCTAQQRIDHQHRVQLRLPHRRDQMPHQIPRRRPGSLPGGRDALQHFDHTRAQHPRRHQVLARQPEQRRRRVVLHRPREQILGQFLPLHPAGPPPAQIPGDQHQMIRTGLLTLAVLAQRPHRKPQPLRQPRHRGRRRRDLVRHVPQPRHCAKLYGYPEHVLRPAEPRTNSSSAAANVKYRNNSTWLISGNPRSRASCSSVNTSRVAMPDATSRPPLTSRHVHQSIPTAVYAEALTLPGSLGLVTAKRRVIASPWVQRN
jgi:hypothetical protein